MTYMKVKYIDAAQSRNWDVCTHTYLCVCVCVLRDPSTIEPWVHFAKRFTFRSVRHTIWRWHVAQNGLSQDIRYAGEHIRLAFPFNNAPHYRQLLREFRVTLSGVYVHACTTPFSAGMCTINAHGQTCQLSQSAVFHVSTSRLSYFWNALCMLRCICATCVSVFGDYRQLWGTV